MCILAVASAGATFSRDTLKRMWYANDDGAGWAYAKDGKIYYAKGYTNANKFIKAVLKLPIDCERMVHCRIATHGGVTKGLTHPFPISRDYTRLEMLSGTLSHGYILAHNGILNNFKPDKNHSDTEELARCLANIKCDIMGEDMRDIINTLVIGSRVAILNTDGRINRYGSGWTERGGIWYSNMHFDHYGSYYAYYYGDAWDDYYAYCNGKSTATQTATQTESRLPELDELIPLPAGEIIRNKSREYAYINATDGSYLYDPQTHRLYGQYRGEVCTSDYDVCDCMNCQTCEYNCPIAGGGD